MIQTFYITEEDYKTSARVICIDSLSAYLEEYTLPGQTVNLTVVRNNETINIHLELEVRPNTNTI